MNATTREANRRRKAAILARGIAAYVASRGGRCGPELYATWERAGRIAAGAER